MTGRTHDLAAVTALGVVALAQSPLNMTLGTALMALLANQIGGILPDIDQPTAPFWRNLPIGGTIGRVIDKMLGGHRFISHSLVGLAIFGGLGYVLLKFLHPSMPHLNITIVWWAFMVGLVSHLIMDTFTKEGVPWLLPIPVKFGLPPIAALRVATGKKFESFIVFPGLIALDVFLCASHYQLIRGFLHTHIR
jgi:inner membrane protein